MGGVVSSIFGMGQASAPELPATPVRENETEAESKAVRDEERRKIKARQGLAGTILTNQQGQGGSVLGRLG